MANEQICNRITRSIANVDNRELLLKCICHFASQMYLLTNHMSYDEINQMFADVLYNDNPSEEDIYRLQRFVDKVYANMEPMLNHLNHQ